MLSWLHRARVRAGAPLALLLISAVLAGCGSSGNGVTSKSATQILAAAKAAAASATSMHVVSKASQGPLSVASTLDLASDGGRASVSLLGVVYELVRVGNTLYAKGNSAFYKRLASAAAHVPQGAWLKAPANSGKLAQLAAFTNLSRELNLLLSTGGPITKGATSTVNGQKAIELKETAKLFSGTLYIATTGKPYPIKIVKRGRETGQITFSGWNAPVSLSAPANAIAIR